MVTNKENLVLRNYENRPFHMNQVATCQSPIPHQLIQSPDQEYWNITNGNSCSHSQMTPPATPHCSQEDLHHTRKNASNIDNNFLRAFYPFNPICTLSEKTVTLPIQEGDVIRVHSVHPNGWADGTILTTGERGWLPTNYCKSYYPEQMRDLLEGLIIFCDLLQKFATNSNKNMPNHEFMRGMIAGVRYLLEQTSCLKKESVLIRDCEILRRIRKSLLSDLSALVKNSKSLYELVNIKCPTESGFNSIENVVDSMTLMAFNITIRGVEFLDIWNEVVQPPTISFSSTKYNMSAIDYYRNPPSPPADSTQYDLFDYTHTPPEDVLQRKSSLGNLTTSLPSYSPEFQIKDRRFQRTTTIPRSLGTRKPLTRSKSPAQTSMQRDYFKLTDEPSASCNPVLVSEKLISNHDTLLSFLGSFIGKLHLHTQSSADLVDATEQFVTVGRDLLLTVEMICDRDPQSAQALQSSKNAVETKFQHLIRDAQEIIQSSGDDDESIVLPDQKSGLLTASSGCVRAAGECVAKTTLILEQIGDFPYSESKVNKSKPPKLSLNSSQDTLECIGSDYFIHEPSSPPPPPPLASTLHENLLPIIPTNLSPQSEGSSSFSSTYSPCISGSNSLSDLSATHMLSGTYPTSPTMEYEITTSENLQVYGNNEDDNHASDTAKCSETNNTQTSNTDDDQKFVTQSQSSTRVNTPEPASYSPNLLTSNMNLNLTENFRNLEAGHVLEGQQEEKTYEHELLYNKDGAIIGGTISALVEKLTNHHSTPDSLFVSTFYLTFRLFATPEEFATALIDRFDNVAEDTRISCPVHLRVYNVFKGWLESHWCEAADHSALHLIELFALEKLEKVIHGAGRRLKQLAVKVSSSQRPLVPRTVSLIGKSSNSSMQNNPSDSLFPPPALNRGASLMLKNWKAGSVSPSILDFDPLEIARQLTIKGMSIFISILPEELLGSEWTKRPESGAKNVRAMAALSTELSTLVSDSILQHDDVKKRANIMKHWIKIAHKCLELNNYDSLMAILCAMNSSSIVRLKKTWDALSQRRKEMLRSLQTIVEPEKNYAVLRRRLHDHVPPCLPFVGLYLTDLTFIEAGNPPTRQLPPNGSKDGIQVINFDKHTRTAKIITDLQRFQFNYRLTEVPELQEWIQSEIDRFRTSTENELAQDLYRKSLLLEPRGSQSSFRNPNEGSLPSASKEKFDIFGWAHRERSNSLLSPAASFP